MRKIMIILSLIMCYCSVYAQSSNEFMGIPIEGNVHVFAKKLEAKGFQKVPIVYNNDDRANGFTINYYFTGTFYGEPNARIHLCSTPNNNIMQVRVMWSYYSMVLYSALKQGLINKYPTEKGFMHDTSRDISLMSHVDVSQTINSGGSFQFGIYKPNDKYLSIAVSIGKSIVEVVYTNTKTLLESETAKRKQGESDL